MFLSWWILDYRTRILWIYLSWFPKLLHQDLLRFYFVVSYFPLFLFPRTNTVGIYFRQICIGTSPFPSSFSPNRWKITVRVSGYCSSPSSTGHTGNGLLQKKNRVFRGKRRFTDVQEPSRRFSFLFLSAVAIADISSDIIADNNNIFDRFPLGKK